MPDIVTRLKTAVESGTTDPALIADALDEITELRQRRDKLEMVLIMLARTGWPWREDGEPNEILHSCRDGYGEAMLEAKELLGLNFRSRLTRTEPKT